MKQTTAIGIVMAIVMLLLAVMMEGGSPASLINIPAFLIVAGGTSGAVLASTTFAMAKAMPKLAILAVKGVEHGSIEIVAKMVHLAEKARREGLLALEDELPDLDDDFARKGVQLVVDGADSDVVGAILEAEIEATTERHMRNAGLFATAGGFAPTLGILGTVLSLVHVLENLSSPATLGHSIAGAFLATLYGVGSANIVFIPIGNRLKDLSAMERTHRELVLEATLSIQAGDNPRMLADKLQSFLPPEARAELAQRQQKPAAVETQIAEAA